MKNTVFFESKSWWEDDVYWLMKSSCFGPWKVFVLNFLETGNMVVFEPKLDRKIMFTWSFWVFQDIPRPLKYDFRTVICHVILLSFNLPEIWIIFISSHFSYFISSNQTSIGSYESAEIKKHIRFLGGMWWKTMVFTIISSVFSYVTDIHNLNFKWK